MAEKLSHKRKASLLTQAQRMRDAKASKRREESGEDTPTGSSSQDESILLPGPVTGEDSDEWEGSDEDSDSEFEGTFTREDADGVYQDWLVGVDRDDVKMLALMVHDNYTERFGLTNTAAAAEVGLLLGFNEKTIRRWRKDFYTNKREFSEYRRGKYVRYAVLEDEEYRDMTLEWIRANAYTKGSPNMPALRFRS